MNAVMALICSRGLSGAVPVPESTAERLKAMERRPLLKGSKTGSPRGMGMRRVSPGLASGVRLMSWSRNWPHCHTMSVARAVLGIGSVWADTMLLTERGAGRSRSGSRVMP